MEAKSVEGRFQRTYIYDVAEFRFPFSGDFPNPISGSQQNPIFFRKLNFSANLGKVTAFCLIANRAKTLKFGKNYFFISLAFFSGFSNFLLPILLPSD